MKPDKNVPKEVRSLRHTVDCASGARAEMRGPCNCDAADRPAAWAIEFIRVDNGSAVDLTLRITAPDTMTTVEAHTLVMALHDLAGPLVWRNVRHSTCERCRARPQCSTSHRFCVECAKQQQAANNEPTNERD